MNQSPETPRLENPTEGATSVEQTQGPKFPFNEYGEINSKAKRDAFAMEWLVSQALINSDVEPSAEPPKTD